jgi:asparagine synthase (glutamine-hydrolysing)
MCGIVGIIDSGYPSRSLESAVAHMLATLEHRGPDGDGYYRDDECNLVLGHRRLAIIDPEHGKQPMMTQDGRLTVVFNGAIYNYLELRRELIAKGHSIRTYSDTEVLLYAYRQWGVECVQRFLGMFAFAIWDKVNRCLFCARDRVGIKPFYYVLDEKTFVFASEIKAIIAEASFKAEPDPDGLQDYLTFQFCLGEKTLFRGIRRLEPGHSLTIRLKGDRPVIETHQYWDVSYDIDEEHDES